jgi:hypothetical protein
MGDSAPSYRWQDDGEIDFKNTQRDDALAIESTLWILLLQSGAEILKYFSMN